MVVVRSLSFLETGMDVPCFVAGPSRHCVLPNARQHAHHRLASAASLRSPRLATAVSCSARAGPSAARVSRRRALVRGLGALALALGQAALGQGRAPATAARAAMYAADTAPDQRYASARAAGTLAPLMPQIRDGYDALVALSADWDRTTAAMDGDVVRRVLGTVGVASPLFNIRKTFLKAWQIIAESGEVDEGIIDRMESEWNAVLDGLSSIDFQVYSVGFTELQETKLNLLASCKAALDSTILTYKSFSTSDWNADLLDRWVLSFQFFLEPSYGNEDPANSVMLSNLAISLLAPRSTPVDDIPEHLQNS
jgi:hypothetical protein